MFPLLRLHWFLLFQVGCYVLLWLLLMNSVMLLLPAAPVVLLWTVLRFFKGNLFVAAVASRPTADTGS